MWLRWPKGAGRSGVWTTAGLVCLALAAVCFVRIVRNARNDLASATTAELMINHVGIYVLYFTSLATGCLLLGWAGH